MKHLLLSLVFGLTLNAAEIGWSGSTFRADSLVNAPLAVTVTVDGQVLASANRSVIELSSDSAVAVNRDFTLRCPNEAGHRITIYFTGLNAARLEDDVALDGSCAGAVRLSSNWTAATSATLTLVSTATDYLEVGRANN